jgi:hypothetical protein
MWLITIYSNSIKTEILKQTFKGVLTRHCGSRLWLLRRELEILFYMELKGSRWNNKRLVGPMKNCGESTQVGGVNNWEENEKLDFPEDVW